MANFKRLFGVIIVILALFTSSCTFFDSVIPTLAEDGEGDNLQNSLADQLRELTEGKVRISTHAKTGNVRFIGTELSHPVPRQAALKEGATPEEAARGFLSTYGEVFGLSDQARELTVMHSKTVDDRRSFVRFQQVYDDVPVMGGELIVQVSSARNIISANGEILPDISLDTTPTVATSSAQETALNVVVKEYGIDPDSLRVSKPELWIYNPIILGMNWDINTLVWRMEVEAVGLLPISELVLVDAHMGVVALHFSQVATTKNRLIYDNQNNSAYGLPGNGPVRSEGEGPHSVADVNYAYDYTGDTYDFYSAYHGRDSIDDAGMTIISTVRYCEPGETCPYPNAYWTPAYQQMVFGQGYASADDVVGHEMTHGVTSYESNLFYYMQSGAINEAFSDIWGEFIDLTNGAGNDDPSVRWLMGEDLPIGAIRDMSNPTLYSDPDRMTSSYYVCGATDYGGVHSNSGVANKAAYLMVDGEFFNGYTVAGFGGDTAAIVKAADLWYEVQTNMFTSASDYADLYDCLQQAAINLGFSSADQQTVKDAVDATEMDQQPTSCPATEAPICDTGSISNLWFDDLESGAGNWAIGAYSGSSEWYYGSFYATSGVYHLWGNDQDSIADYYCFMTSDVALPSGAYLHFNHAYAFEGSDYDGGVVEYSLDGGTNWYDAGALFTHNGYTGTISSCCGNPLGGRSAFVGYSNGYISSRLDLSSLAGENVRFRFRIGTDSSVGDYGWFIDDVRIYTCLTYTLTISSTSGGSVTTPGEGTFGPYNHGDVVNLVAAADSGYHFTGWTGDTGTIANPNAPSTTITMNGDYSITAEFVRQYDLTTNSTEGGSVTEPGEDTFTYDEGTVVDLVATPGAGYLFHEWTGDVGTIADVNAAATNITMNDNYSITAEFVRQYDLSINSTGGGLVNTPGEGAFTYDEGTVVDLVATPGAMVAAGHAHTVGLKCDGTAVAVGGSYYGQCDVGGWTGIVQVSAGETHTVGVKTDGTVVAAGSGGKCNVGGWTGIVQVSAGFGYTVGLKSDGTVVAVGWNADGQCDVGGWTDIVQVSAGGGHTVGLKSDGTVIAVGLNNYGQCNIGGWTGITQVDAGLQHTVGVKSDGTVVAVGRSVEGQCNVGGWTDIIQVAAGSYHTVGLKSDGQCGGWTDIVQVAAGGHHTVGLKSDGTVVAVVAEDWDYGQCDVGGWMLLAHHFVNWTGDVGTIADVNAAATNITMNGDYSITANFAINEYSLTISSTAGGSVTTPGEGTFGPYNPVDVVNLVAIAEPDCHFTSWTGDTGTIANPNAPSTTITMNGDYSITANFNTPPEVSSVSATQRSDGSGIVDISYDVSDNEQSTIDVSLEYWDPSGSWHSCTNTAGDVGPGINTGTGKAATWDAKAQLGAAYISGCKVRVTADDGAGGTDSEESNTFDLDTAPPTGYGCASPEDEAECVSIDEALVCSTASDDSAPIEYKFAIASDAAFSQDLQESGWQQSTNWTPTTALSYGKAYWWRVKARDAKNNESEWSSPFTFVTIYKFDIALKSGWNMISLPLESCTGETDPDVILPDVEVIYTWNCETTSYDSPSEIVPGKGYWALVFEDVTETIYGTPVEEYQLSSDCEGWHMVGSLYVDGQVNVGSGSVYDSLYHWNPETLSYIARPLDDVRPGEGYCLLAFTDFSISVVPKPPGP